MPKSARAVLAIAFVLALALPAPAGGALQVSFDGRHLVDANGQPFLLIGDAGWSLPTQLDRDQARTYLDDRAARGFNLVVVRLIEHLFCADPPANAYGDLPFTGEVFTTPNPAYFDHVDYLVSLAAERGIIVLLAPVYLGYECGPQGWCVEVEGASLEDMRVWGRFVGQRYGAFDNIVWLIGGDADPTPVADKLREVVAGIREYDVEHLITCHNQAESQAIAPWPDEDWIGINNVYTYSRSLYVESRAAYDVTPPRPFFLMESAYENEHGTTSQTLRAQSYWSVLAGSFGHIFGNCPIWHFGYSTSWCDLADWVAELDDPGSVNMTFVRRLFESRHWHALVPDFDNLVVTDGYGMWESTDYAMAASTQDGSSIIAYLPSPRAVTVDLSTLAGSTAQAWWFSPETGSPLLIGTYPKGTYVFTPPTESDWVLVVDDAALGFPPPGTPGVPSAVTVEAGASPGVSLERIEPSPAGGSVSIRYLLARPAAVRIVILAADGRRVRELDAREQSAGVHATQWDGRDDAGRTVAAGTYLVRVETPEGTASGKVVRVQ